MPNIFYLDYELGNDSNDGSDWANAWKTITSGATAVRIAPGDIIRIAKSPAPTSIGNATWNNLSKVVTLVEAQTLNIDMCETACTTNGSGDITVTRTAVATDGKEGSYCMKLAFDSSPQTSIMEAYYATGELNLSAYQKISFWIKNSGAVTAGTMRIALCSDVAGSTPVDYFDIPAIPSISRWIPLTLTKSGGGNLGASIKSIALYTDAAVTGLASKYIYVDDFIACTTNGLNLQSLISKNTLEQSTVGSANYGNEGWYGIQSINGTAILLDNDTNTKGNAGMGYSGTTETVATYKRETIKTTLASVAGDAVQNVQDSGTVGSNIEFQGGWNISTTEQDGETFFDGLNGFGYGIYLTTKNYITINHINNYRYSTGIYLSLSNNNIITVSSSQNNTAAGGDISQSNANFVTIININNNSDYNLNIGNSNNNIVTIINANNSIYYGVSVAPYCFNNVVVITNANNNGSYGIWFNGSNHNIFTITNANNNADYGVYFNNSFNNILKSLSTTGNTTAGIFNNYGINYLRNALIAEEPKIAGMKDFANSRICINSYSSDPLDNRIYTDNGNIVSQVVTRHTESGIAWQLNPTNVKRDVGYPLTLSVAKIAVVANKLVTVKAWMKLSNTSDILGALVCRGGQLAGVPTDVKTDMSTADTDWHEVEITFTPTETGVVEIEAWAWWVANDADESVYIDDMTITQAD